MADLPLPTHANSQALANVLNSIPVTHGHGFDAISTASKRLKVAKTSFTRTTSSDVVEEEVYKHKLINRHLNGGTDAPNGAATPNDVATAIANACGPGGAIATAIADACGPGGAITTAISTAIADACGPRGAFTVVVDASNEKMKRWVKNDKLRLMNMQATAVVGIPFAERGNNMGNAPSPQVAASFVGRSRAEISAMTHANIDVAYNFYEEPSFRQANRTVDQRRTALCTFLFG